MKKIVALILALVMAFGLCACTQHIDLEDGRPVEFDIGDQTITGRVEGYSVHQSGDSQYVVIDINGNN